jgi:hypothetical protein
MKVLEYLKRDIKDFKPKLIVKQFGITLAFFYSGVIGIGLILASGFGFGQRDYLNSFTTLTIGLMVLGFWYSLFKPLKQVFPKDPSKPNFWDVITSQFKRG